jgi:predicted ATPase
VLSEGLQRAARGGMMPLVQSRGRAASVATMEFLERTEELSRLRGRLAEVAARSRGCLVLVQGEAGIGKTALLRRCCEEAGESVRVLWASCDPLFTPRPLGPLIDIARVTDGELRARIESGAKPHDVVAALIAELEAPAPTVLVLEDLHWADEATLDVVRLLARRIDSLPALLVISYRGEQLHRAHPLRIVLGEFSGVGPVTRLELAGLSREAVALQARSR